MAETVMCNTELNAQMLQFSVPVHSILPTHNATLWQSNTAIFWTEILSKYGKMIYNKALNGKIPIKNGGVMGFSQNF